MKKGILVLFVLILTTFAFCRTFGDLYKDFLETKSYRKSADMQKLIDELSKMDTKDVQIISLYSECLTEYANWGVKDKAQRAKLYEKAVELGKKAVSIDPNSYYANYVTGSGIGRLAQFKGILESLFMLGDFDKYIDKALQIKPDSYVALIAKGMRYRDVPWMAGGSDDKAESYLLKAQKAEPKYQNIYYELGVLYKKMGKKDKAIENLKKVIEMPAHPEWIEQADEAKGMAKDLLKELGAK